MDRHTFLAVPIPGHLQKQIHQYAEKVKPTLPLKKWTSEGDYHITLNFLGATKDNDASQLADDLKKRTTSCKPFELEIGSVGVFGNEKTPRVCWVGVNASEELSQLYKLTSESCSTVGFEVSSRPFRPHITLGKRWGGKTDVDESLPEPEQLKGLTWRVEEVILYEIHPERKQKYVPYDRFKLGEDR